MILFVSQVALSIASSLRQPANIQGTLTIETRQKRGVNARIEGAYRTNDGEGISFKTSQQSLVIQTLDNQILLYTKTIPVTLQSYSDDHNATMIQIMDEAYMESNEKLYRLSNIDVLSEIVASGEVLSHAQLRASVQGELVADREAAMQVSIQRLLAHPAARLLEPTARALGEDMGIIGRDEPAALPLYATAMKISQIYEKSTRFSRSWYNFFSESAKAQAYPNCRLDTCPPCQEDECMGLCGKDCSCWWWVCGDCCLHRGCELHDICCRKSFYSWRCLFPIGLTCNSFSC